MSGGLLLRGPDYRSPPCSTHSGQGEASRRRSNSLVCRQATSLSKSDPFLTTASGTTRDNFAGKPVKELQYSAYNKLALRTMMAIAKDMVAKHSLKGIALIHRLGTVPVGEESILIALSSPHRQAAWRAGEEALEECKSKVEVWKREEFEGEEGVWRANRDGIMVKKISESEGKGQDGVDEPRGSAI